MTKKVIVNSIHSDSIDFIRTKNPEVLISFDAHPDLGHWNHQEVPRSILKLDIPQRIKSALFRTSIQALLRAALSESKIISVVPEACVITDFNWQIFQRLFFRTDSRHKNFTKKLAISEWRKKLSILSNIGYLSPPNGLDSLSEWSQGKSLVLDIDADYLFELTQECHSPAGFSDTPIPVYGMPQDNLGSEKKILGFIAKTKPDLITLSEMTFKALDSADSKINQFLHALESLNYSTQRGIVYNDSELEAILKIKADFDSFYLKQSKSKRYKNLLDAYLDFFELLGLT